MERQEKYRNISGLFNRVLNGKKIKYNTLYTTAFKFFRQEETNEVNIFFNLVPLCHSFQRKDYLKEIIELDNKQKYSLAAELLNWCAHYRHFYWSRFQIHTSFYLYYTFQDPVYKQQIYPNYMKDYSAKNSLENPEYGVLNALLKENLDLASSISEYIPHVYVFNTLDFDIIGLPYLFIERLRQSNKNCANLLFTNVEIDYLAMRFPFTRIALGNEFGFLHRDEIYQYLAYKGKFQNEITEEYPLEYDHLHYMLALKGDTKHGIIPVPGFNTFKKAIHFLLECRHKHHSLLEKKPADVTVFLEKTSLSDAQKEQFLRNYNLIDPTRYGQYLSDRTNREIENKFLDLEDNQSIMNINQVYFPYNNIQLIELMEGEYRILNNKLIKY